MLQYVGSSKAEPQAELNRARRVHLRSHNAEGWSADLGVWRANSNDGSKPHLSVRRDAQPAIPARTIIAATNNVEQRRFALAPGLRLKKRSRDARLRPLLDRVVKAVARRFSIVLTFFVESAPLYAGSHTLAIGCESLSPE